MKEEDESNGALDDEALLDVFSNAKPAEDDLVERVLRAKVRGSLFGREEREHLGRLELRSPIGRGGMGSVLEAYDPALERRVAVKIMRPERKFDRGRALAEARALAKLNHAHVVSVFDVGEHDGGVYVVMEFVEGQSLRQWLATETPRGRQQIRQVLRWMRDIGNGLIAAHDAGLLHRDIKPDNILVAADGAKLVDFGLAATIGDGDARDNNRSVAGTLGYIAPEVLAGEPAGQQSDQYAFFKTLGELVGNEVPSWLSRAIARGSADDPRARFPTMRTALRALDRRRARAVAGGFALVAATAAISVGASLMAAPPRCERSLDSWNEARAGALRSSLSAIDAPFAAASAARLIDALADAAQQWESTYQDVCERSQDGAQSPALLDARMACLDREREAIGAWADALEAIDGPRELAQATQSNDISPSACGQISGGLAADPALADEWAALARAEASMRLRRYDRATEQMREVTARTMSAEDPRFIAERDLVAAHLEARRGDKERARMLYDSAMQAAARSEDADLEVDVWLATVRHELLSGSPDRALEWVLFATAAHNRADRQTNELAGLEGEAYRYLGQSTRARERLRFALQGEDLRPQRRAIAHLNLGSLALDEDLPADARAHYEDALEIVTESLGPEHPGRTLYLDVLGAALMAAGDIEGAMQQHEEALQLRRETYGDLDRSVASSLLRLARCRIAQLELEGVEEMLDDAHRIRSQAYGAEDIRTARVELVRGALREAEARDDEAMAIYGALWEQIGGLQTATPTRETLLARMSQLLAQADAETASEMRAAVMAAAQGAASARLSWRRLQSAAACIAPDTERAGFAERAAEGLGEGSGTGSLMAALRAALCAGAPNAASLRRRLEALPSTPLVERELATLQGTQDAVRP